MKINCPGVSFEDRATFFDPGNFLRKSSKSFDTSISIGSLSALSAISLSPIAFSDGGQPLSADMTTLYHFSSYFLSFSVMIFSNVNTSICPRDSRTLLLVISM